MKGTSCGGVYIGEAWSERPPPSSWPAGWSILPPPLAVFFFFILWYIHTYIYIYIYKCSSSTSSIDISIPIYAPPFAAHSNPPPYTLVSSCKLHPSLQRAHNVVRLGRVRDWNKRSQTHCWLADKVGSNTSFSYKEFFFFFFFFWCMSVLFKITGSPGVEEPLRSFLSTGWANSATPTARHIYPQLSLWARLAPLMAFFDVMKPSRT